MTKLAPEWVQTSDPVIRSPARYRWTKAPTPLTSHDAKTVHHGDWIVLIRYFHQEHFSTNQKSLDISGFMFW